MVAFVLTAVIVFPSSARLRYGFRFGSEIAASRISDAPDTHMVNNGGFTGGLVLEYQFPKCGFAPDIAVLYTRYNSRVNAGGDVMSGGRNFIEIPVHLKYKFWLHNFHDLFGPMIYTGPSMMFRAGGEGSGPYRTKTFQPGWDVGIGFDIVNFIQIAGGYRFGLGNSLKHLDGCPEAVMRSNGWHISATLLFDF